MTLALVSTAPAADAVSQTAPDLPEVADLNACDQLLLWCLRRRHEGDDSRRMIRYGIGYACGALAADQAYGSFERCYSLITGHCRRSLKIGCVADACLSRDECALMALIDSARRRQTELAQRRSEWLIRSEMAALCCREVRQMVAAFDQAAMRTAEPVEDGAASPTG
ncbi:hypothetical protein [Marinivivus vitaminiproducens]|uniref:hypothetical protein n=1 Tax=Marinivivus vitaminiproducens TaxID=3035935 RepID=UPI0027AA04F1|nr:hypothetical protein P4R82_08520 [Geminicoccaceae bacterium SCSIO 64248]